jgi:hypothetical protein
MVTLRRSSCIYASGIVLERYLIEPWFKEIFLAIMKEWLG